MAFLIKLQRKDAFLQLANDIMRNNMTILKDCQTSHDSNVRLLSSASSISSNQILNINSSFKNSIHYHKALRKFSNLSSSTSAQTHIDFKELSVLNRNIVSKITLLESDFIDKYKDNIKFTQDGNKIVFTFNEFETKNGIQKMKKSSLTFDIGNSNFKRVHKNFDETNFDSKFKFFALDSCLIKLLNDKQTKNIKDRPVVIFDDPLNASLFQQETGIPVIVFRFSQIDNHNSWDICQKLNDSFSKIYIWSRNVDFSNDFRKNCLKLFDQKRLVRITDDDSVIEICKNKKNVQNNKKDLLEKILSQSSPIERSGIVHVKQTGEELFKFLNDTLSNGKQWSRFLKLNEELKGHRPGELTIITGPTGSGKTTFISEYSLDLCIQGLTTLWGSFEMRYMSLEKMMMTQLMRKSFDASNRQEFDEAFEEFSKLPLYFLNFHGQTDIEIVLKEAKHAVLMYGVEHLIIDNLQFMLGLSPESINDRFFKQDYVLGMIRQFATEYNCHVTLVAHPRKEKEEFELSNNSLYGGIKASQEADNVMIVMNKYNARYRCNKYVQITKNRAYGNLGVIPLYFDKNSLCFSPNPQHAQQQQQQQQQFPPTLQQSQTFFQEPSKTVNYESFKHFLKEQDRPF